MKRIRWTRHALSQFDEIAVYLRERSPQAADRVAKRIRSRVGQLAEHPFIGRAGRQPRTRELFIGRYRYKVVYRVSDDVEILAVFHTAREADDAF